MILIVAKAARVLGVALKPDIVSCAISFILRLRRNETFVDSTTDRGGRDGMNHSLVQRMTPPSSTLPKPYQCFTDP
jgi:hypothetical protein